MTTWRKPTPEDVDRVLANVGKEIDRLYFFTRLRNPEWLKPLAERGVFRSPPSAIRLSETTIQYPFWPELQYLENISQLKPHEVADIVIALPNTSNIRIYDHIVDLALEMPPRISTRLLPKILEKIECEPRYTPVKAVDVLTLWVEHEQISAAMELTKVLIGFEADPNADEKYQRWVGNPKDYRSLLDPVPSLDEWQYSNLLSGPVRVLSERMPFKMSRILIDTAANAIYLRYHREELHQRGAEDGSQFWCQRLSDRDHTPTSVQERLVQAMTFACEAVFGTTECEIAQLDKLLTEQRWELFKRLQHHLYAAFPTEQSKPWIREALLTYDDYSELRYGYEFQKMIASACTTFGESFLTGTEIDQIVTSILAGPSREEYLKWHGDAYTEEDFERHRKRVHRLQLRPFGPVLSGEAAEYYRDLEDAAGESITDNDYSPIQEVKSGIVRDSSPRSQAELRELTDEHLLTYINDWDDEHRDDQDWFVHISIRGLAQAFQDVVKQTIIPDNIRLSFWLTNRERVHRPIYIRAIVIALHSCLEDGHLDRLTETLTFCEWVLSHQDQREFAQVLSRQDPRESLNWSPARRAVLDLIETCLKPEVALPAAAHSRIASNLRLIATQYDYRLDNKDPVIQKGIDHLTEAINNTRSRALGAIVDFWSLLASVSHETDPVLASSLLDHRLSRELPHPLTLPEYAILGSRYGAIINLDESWAARNRATIFPHQSTSAWRASFGAFLAYTGPSQKAYSLLLAEYNRALECPEFLRSEGVSSETNAHHLGYHLFIYYVWGIFQLHGDSALLAKLYHATADDREIWAGLLSHIGHLLRNSGSDVGQDLVNRIVEFFEWRIAGGEAVEFSAQIPWIQVKCLDPKWRLCAYSRVLDIVRKGDADPSLLWLHTEALTEFLPEYLELVMECFAKLTGSIKRHAYGIPDSTAKSIIAMGLASDDKCVIEHAENARNNLLRLGRFDLLDIGEQSGDV